MLWAAWISGEEGLRLLEEEPQFRAFRASSLRDPVGGRGEVYHLAEIWDFSRFKGVELQGSGISLAKNLPGLESR